jgi:hypothetical protein
MKWWVVTFPNGSIEVAAANAPDAMWRGAHAWPALDRTPSEIVDSITGIKQIGNALKWIGPRDPIVIDTIPNGSWWAENNPVSPRETWELLTQVMS